MCVCVLVVDVAAGNRSFLYLFSCTDAEKVTQLRVQHMESLISRLQKEKRAMDEEFGRQRKKFMNQMMQTECKLNPGPLQISDNHHEKSLQANGLCEILGGHCYS